MDRRNFIKTTTTSSALIVSSGLWAFDQNRGQVPGKIQYCNQSERDIPIAYKVDVVVVGGSTAGVAAAVKATQSGASVFLAAQEPYLGEDICGYYRFWLQNEKVKDTALGEKIFGNGLPTPMHVKRILDNELIENDIDFLYSSYVTDIIVDEKGIPAGVVISNRNGRQAILAKVIIDATPRAMVIRMTNAQFMNYPTGKQQFSFIVVGNDKKPGLQVEDMPESIKIEDKSYSALKYTIDIEMTDGSWFSFAEAEQIVRDLTWDPNQVDSADLLFQVPPDNMVGQKRWNKADVNTEEISLKVFQPRNAKRIFALNGCADLSREAAENLLQPAGLIRIGERIGEYSAILVSNIPELKNVVVPGEQNLTVGNGDIGELLEGLRPSLNIEYLKAETTTLPVLAEYDVVVIGGGTAGAPSGLGAARQGASTLVIDYMHGMGGVGTLGLIGRYYHGYREGFTNEVDNGVKAIGGDNPRKKENLFEWVFDWKTEWFRSEIRKAGGEIWFGVLGCGAYVEDGQVKGVVVATPNGKGVVLGHTVIDSTGSADIAIAAGAGYRYTDGLSVAIQGAGLPPKKPNDFYNNTDWTFTNDTDMLDVWRTFVVGKEKFKDQYDIGKLPQTRERRRVIGDFTVSVLDVYNNRTYPDTISIHKSSFDTHGFTIDPFFALKPPAHSGIDVIAYVPFRALLPKGLEGIIVTGLGASAHRDAMPVIRMQPCLQNQGYAVGWAAAIATHENQKIRYIDIKMLQKELVKIGNLTESILTDKDNYPPANEKIQEAAKTVVNDMEGLEILLWQKEKAIPALSDQYYFTQNESHKLVYALILGMLDNDTGWKTLKNTVDKIQEWDVGWNYTGMGQFGLSMSYIDSLIIALGKSKKQEAIPGIIRMAEMLTYESYFSHFRAVAIALETIASAEGAKILYDLLMLPGVMGHSMPDIHTAKKLTPPDNTDTSTRNNSLRELILGRALFKCGDYNGVGNQILQEYSNDLRGHFYRHATGVLQMFSKPIESQKEL